MKKCVILSTDTAHHRYFINRILDEGIEITACIFETTHVHPPFHTGPCFEGQEDAFEKENFFKNVRSDLDRVHIDTVESVNDDQCKTLLEKYQPDYGCLFGTRKVKPHVIEAYKDLLLNVHRGIPHRYRGVDSDLWAIYHRDWDNIGTAIHKVDVTLDTGKFADIKWLKLKKGMKIWQLRYYTTVLGTDIVIKAFKDYLAGKLELTPQEKVGRYYSFMPLCLKETMVPKFNKYCEKLPE